MAQIFRHVPHPRTRAVLDGAAAPVTVAAQLPRGSAVQRFNTAVALKVTKIVGSMWCAYAFALFDLISLPAAIRGGAATIVAWVAQTFLQLVLLSIIMVGQNVAAEASDKRSAATFADAEAVLHEALQIQEHLKAQDDILLALRGGSLGLTAPLEKRGGTT